jgi:ribulose-5-phosphate 4-epimerase/fuculose-1-phosphate aldolase
VTEDGHAAAVGLGPPPGEAERRFAAERIVACCHLLASEGLVAGFGHLSERAGKDSFFISGKVPLGTISVEEVALVNGAEPEESRAHIVPFEMVLHAAIYRARPDVGAIARTHGEFGSVLSLLGDPVRPVHAFGATLGPQVPVYDTCELIEDDAEGARLVAALDDATAVLMRGNGQVVCGADLAEACVLACHLEESARLQHRARSADSAGRLRYLTAEETSAAAANLRSRPQILRAFRALCDRHGVSFAGGAS